MVYELLIYSLKVGACLAVFYLFFKLLLSRETFHRFNRVVVLGAMLLSFVLPLCVITVRRELPVVPTLLFTEPLPVGQMPQPTDSFPWRTLLGGLFLAGAVVTFVRTLVSLSGVLRMIRRGRRERLDDGTILVRFASSVTPCSWGRYVVISDRDLSENGEAILAHERAHARLHHSVDILVTDLAGCLQWFNPAMWLLRRELRSIHEYEADEAVLESGVDARSYQMLLIRKAVGGRWYSVANSFNHSKLKNRITMMLRKKSSRRAEARALLLLPLAGLALGAFAETRYVVPAYKDTQNLSESEMSAPQGDTLRGRPVVIRGREKLTDGETRPLILVDGKRVDYESLKALSPEQIASIMVLKDSLSLAPYGADAKDGVIIVELKGADETTSAADSSRVIVLNHRSQGGTPSGENTMRISISGEHSGISASGLPGNPVILIDGKRFDGDLNTISPERIASMSVYKGNVPEAYRRYVGAGNEGLILIETKKKTPQTFDNSYFQSDEWQRAQMQLSDMGAYFQSDEWQEAQKKLAALSPENAEWQVVQKQLSEMGDYFESDEWKEAQRKLRQLSDRLTPQAENNPEVPYNTVVGPYGGMLVTGPEVMSKSRNEADRSVTIARGRVTADFSEIDEADYRIEIDGKPAVKADLEQIEPGKIRRVESISPDAASGRKGELRVRTRK